MPQEQTTELEFADFIREFAHGSTNRAATERLREVIAACMETGAKGSITIKFSIDTKQGLAEIKSAISVKKPEAGLPGGHYYATPDGRLHDEDPRQTKLPLKVIPQPIPIKNATINTNGEG
jgi:hypothetical protein